MPFTGDEDDVAFLRQLDGATDGAAPVFDNLKSGGRQAGLDFVKDGRGRFPARIV